MRALVVGHDHVGGVEHVGGALVARGYALSRWTVVPRFEAPGDAVGFPPPDRWDLVVTLGAPWPRHRIASWVHREQEFLLAARRAGAAVLGICFGAQVLAETLGGSTGPLPAPRVGWSEVHGLGDGTWFCWQADQLVAPPTAEVLAVDVDGGTAAFRVGRCAGVQFHPEMTPALLERWFAVSGEPADAEALRTDTVQHAPGAAARTPALLDALLN